MTGITAAKLEIKIATEGARQAKRDLGDLGAAIDANSRARMLGAGLFSLATHQAITFGEAMANVNAIAEMTDKELKASSKRRKRK